MQYPVGQGARKRQRGIGFLAILFILVIAGFFLTIGFKLGPHYLEFLTVKSVMKAASEDPSAAEGGKIGISKTIQDTLYINSISTIDAKDFKFKKRSGGYVVTVDYKVQEHLFSNVDAVLSFNHEVFVGKR